jgi:hypothetical protein
MIVGDSFESLYTDVGPRDRAHGLSSRKIEADHLILNHVI